MYALRGLVSTAHPNSVLSRKEWKALFDAYLDPSREISVKSLCETKGKGVSPQRFYKKLNAFLEDNKKQNSPAQESGSDPSTEVDSVHVQQNKNTTASSSLPMEA